MPAARPFRTMIWPLLAVLLGTTACDQQPQDAISVVVLDSDPEAARTIRGATTEGLVGVDQEGRIIPALADRWIVTDDGQSYIFRLRDGTWANGRPLTGESARAALRQALAAQRGTPLRVAMAGIDEIRAMAGRVVEIRLSRPMPHLLQLLAQPELGLTHQGQGAGPMALRREGEVSVLTAIPPDERGLPAVEDWAERTRVIRLTSEPAKRAVSRFVDGKADVVLGGTFNHWPPVLGSTIPGQAIKLDPVVGLFGLIVAHTDGFLAEAENREAVAMAIDRAAIAEVLRGTGWVPTTRIVTPDTEGDEGLVAERWTELTLAQRQAIAASRVARWRDGRAAVTLRIALPAGPGADLLFRRLAQDLQAAGFSVRRVPELNAADLRLIDSVAAYSGADWFMTRLSCRAEPKACSPPADAKFVSAQELADPAARARMLAEAEAELAAANVFIPFGPPLRFSLARPAITGLAANRLGLHPLLPLALHQPD